MKKGNKVERKGEKQEENKNNKIKGKEERKDWRRTRAERITGKERKERRNQLKIREEKKGEEQLIEGLTKSLTRKTCALVKINHILVE